MQTFYTLKEAISRVHREPTEWERTFTNYTTDRYWYTKLQRISEVKYQGKELSIDKGFNGFYIQVFKQRNTTSSFSRNAEDC